MRALNSPLEVGVRALVLLAASFPRPLDLAQLVYLDYAMLHSGEMDGPPSVHPSLPAGPGELAMKRQLLEQGLVVLMRAGLADVQADDGGLMYRASEEGPGFLDLLEAPYVAALRERAQWALAFHSGAPADSRSPMDDITRQWMNTFDSRLPRLEDDDD
ncbi:ABC-three component system middle component 2 [Streptomyces griseorubiginosus]|uniref:ABC-three component system middle component 2 n=1 Tax=Streptomyces griseorubiginosus TaxID=67304 RepID=UPI00363B1957